VSNDPLSASRSQSTQQFGAPSAIVQTRCATIGAQSTQQKRATFFLNAADSAYAGEFDLLMRNVDITEFRLRLIADLSMTAE